MTYEETVNWMYAQLPMYQSQGKVAYKEDLTNIIKLSNHLNNPEKKFKTIHVAGTNGKGSTSHMIASVLQEAGYKVGLYTSPHLKSFTERVRINGIEIPKDYVIKFISQNKDFFEKEELSFFEMTVGLAFNFFAEERVDVAVIEVGLGGRLDATNIISPEISVITNIGLDHTQILGDTLEKIATEKGGIIKENIPVVIGEKQDEVAFVFEKIAKNLKSELIFASEINIPTFKTDLLGSYQKKNSRTAVYTLKQLKGFSITDLHIKNGLLKVVENTNLKGRWQILNEVPKVICDTAHNKEGLTYVLEQLKKETYDKLHIVLGVVSDKKLDEILPLFPKEAIYYFSKPDMYRGLNEEKLQKEAKKYEMKGGKYTNIKSAYKEAVKKSKKEDLIFIGGSTFTVSEIL